MGVADSPLGFVGVDFQQQKIVDFHKKNFKGLFFHQYGYPFPEEHYELLVIIDENDNSSLTSELIGYIKKHFTFKYSGHKDVFKYCIQPLRENISEKTNKEDLELCENEGMLVCAMTCNYVHSALVIAVRKDYINKIKIERQGLCRLKNNKES